MDKGEFVDVIRHVVVDAAASDTIGNLRKPPGRRPTESLRRLAEWFNALPIADQKNVEQVIGATAHSAVFGFFCVLDGLRQIESATEKGVLDLRFRKGHIEVPLAGDEGDYLHELFNTSGPWSR